MSRSFSPCRSPGPGSWRIQLSIGVSRLRSSSLRRTLPEPLRRAVADCLSSSSSPIEPSRTLREYLAAPATTDLAYTAILEHTVAERERSPAVVKRCVALLKCYLLRYKPSEETLIQIDRFCSTIIAECDIILNQPWSQYLNRQSGASTMSTNTSPLLVSSFASEAILKSLSYVRSLVVQHIPKRLFQPASFAGPPSTSGKSLPTLSSLLTKSFNSQLCPASVPENLEKDSISSLVSKSSKIENFDRKDELGFIAHDVLQWRWVKEQKSSSISAEEEDSPVRTFRPRARQLFQYHQYSEQQPLRLNPAEVCEVIAAVCSDISSPNTNAKTVSTRLSYNNGKPSMNVAANVLIKLIIDMYVLDPRIAFPLTLSMLEEMLSSSETACRVQAFDLIINLGVHAHLLESMIADDASTIKEEYSQESFYDSDTQLLAQGSRKGNSQNKWDTFSPIDNFESWILNILYEILLLLVQDTPFLIDHYWGEK